MHVGRVHEACSEGAPLFGTSVWDSSFQFKHLIDTDVSFARWNVENWLRGKALFLTAKSIFEKIDRLKADLHWVCGTEIEQCLLYFLLGRKIQGEICKDLGKSWRHKLAMNARGGGWWRLGRSEVDWRRCCWQQFSLSIRYWTHLFDFIAFTPFTIHERPPRSAGSQDPAGYLSSRSLPARNSDDCVRLPWVHREWSEWMQNYSLRYHIYPLMSVALRPCY